MTIKKLRIRKPLTQQEKKRLFNRNKNVVNRFVRGFLSKNRVGIVHGRRATNVQLPIALRRKTKDWDVFVKNPLKRALQLERNLDRRFRGNFFRVQKGMGSPGIKVFKVKSNVDDSSVVDFANFNRVVPSVPLRGVRFATLVDQKKRAELVLREKTAPFRKEKDLDLLRRIKQFEKVRGKKIE